MECKNISVLIKYILVAFISALLFCSLTPTLVVGFKFPIIINICACFTALYLVLSEKKSIIRKILTTGISIFAVIYIVFTGLFGFYSARKSEQQPQTLIVLGCKINLDQPSLMLSRRLDTAIKYLNENENVFCIVSGGQGSDEIISEALAMKNYLINNNINEDRIFVEDKSKNTRENIAFSKKIIDNNNLPQNVVIATDNFHQMRSQIFAEQSGLNSSSAGSCETPWYMVSYYWTREMLACVQLIRI